MTAIGDLLAREARRAPEREAVIFGDRRLTHAELDLAVDRWAAALQRRGVGHGDRLAMLVPNSDDFLLYRGPGVMKGYWNQPEATAQTLRDGWLHTGDLVRLDADGYMTVVDRLKDVIITAGRNVYSQEVERVLAGHHAVGGCAVVARPHPVYGESIVAVVTAARAGSPPDLAGIRAHCREQLADYKLPHDLVVLDELPRNAGGKVLKRELRDIVADRADA
jgi:acyl-CoA synthetase (AMP-forming)/AMP-acid ligase II